MNGIRRRTAIIDRCRALVGCLSAGLASMMPLPAVAGAPLVLPEMGIEITLPDDWRVLTLPDEAVGQSMPSPAARAPPSAISSDGTLHLSMLYFENQWLFEVMNPESIARHLETVVESARVESDEKAGFNGLAGAWASGSGSRQGRPVRFEAVLVGDARNEGHTAAVVVVGPAEAMARQWAAVRASLESLRPD